MRPRGHLESECQAAIRELNDAAGALGGLIARIGAVRREAANATAVLAWLDRPTEAQIHAAEATAAAARAEAAEHEKKIPAARNAVTGALGRLESLLQHVAGLRKAADVEVMALQPEPGPYADELHDAAAAWTNEAKQLEAWERELRGTRDRVRRSVAEAEAGFARDLAGGGVPAGRLGGDPAASQPGLASASWLSPRRCNTALDNESPEEESSDDDHE